MLSEGLEFITKLSLYFFLDKKVRKNQEDMMLRPTG